METTQFKFDGLMAKMQIDINDLPEKVQSKINTFDETYEAYEASEENSQEESDALAKLNALDSGITSDLESYLASKKTEQQPPQAAEGAQTQTSQTTPPPSDTPQGDAPSWRFWM
jgi:hypothetical protein